ncbi:MAG: alpha-L-fucosidase [Clostridia bacterium]|nr:alpha-L-fucosidase [Clostridia bacterium]
MRKPKKEQLEFLNWEWGVFFHFGIRTFNEGHADWDMQPMALSSFNPTALDCDEWIRAVRDAGAKYAVLVCKHHDGFANWPSAYTEYSVRNTPWKGGKGDVVKDYVEACRKYGIKVGLYYSPAQFGSAKMNAKEYDDYFIDQIRELLTNYGKIDYLWFDGCGSENHQYDTIRIIAEIRRCQPEILIFNMWDPDTRWAGNEAGVAHSPNRLIVGALDFSIQQEMKELLSEPAFLPVECDCRMRLANWFFSDQDAHTVKTLDELMGLYYYSVGRGANLLINIGPDRTGRLPEEDRRALLSFGAKIRENFTEFAACRVAAQEKKLTLEMPAQLINHAVLTEEITEEEIESFDIKAYPYPYGAPVTVYRGTTIGHKAICQFPAIRTSKIEVSFDRDKRVEARIKFIRQYGDISG